MTTQACVTTNDNRVVIGQGSTTLCCISCRKTYYIYRIKAVANSSADSTADSGNTLN